MVAATAVGGVLAAIAFSPAAAIAGVTITRTNETMQSNLADLTEGSTPGITTITDRTGEPLAYIYNQRRYAVASDQIAQVMKDAIVSVEDRRFYEHDGVDLQGTARALITNLVSGGVAQGASTLDQQYVKNYLLLVVAQDEDEQSAATETSIPRKLREMRMASELDATLSKDEILTRYLNLVPFGNGMYGVEAAAQNYFGVSAADLSLPQAAMLAGLVQSSSYLNPYSNPEGALERRNTVLDTMVTYGAIDEATATATKQEPLGVLEETPEPLPNGCISAGDRGFMCDYVLSYLENHGLPLSEIYRGSYTITTTLDPEVQDRAHEAVARNVDPNQPGVAEVLNVVQPGDSREILAMTSSRDYGLDADNFETIMPQAASLVGNGAGSVFKIFTAAEALEQGMGLDTVLSVPTTYVAQGMGDGGADGCPEGSYCVGNDGTYASSMTLRDALAYSPNTTFVQLLERVGVSNVVDMATRLGLRSYEDEGSFDGESSIAQYFKDHNLGSFTLGPTAVNALELSNVGATIASGGRWCEPNPVLSVTDEDGQEVAVERPECEDVLETDTANALMNGLSQDTVKGTAKDAAASANWTQAMAAKTGTTESHFSAAFIGFNNQFSAAPYIYNDGAETSPICTGPVRQCSEGSLYGGDEPAVTWFDLASSVDIARDGTLPDYNHDYDQGTALASLDDLNGLSEEEARRVLEERGYTVTTRTVTGNGVPKDRVVQAVAAETPLLPGGEVVLELSDGRRVTTTTTPTTSNSTGGMDLNLPDIDTDQLGQFTDELRSRLGL